MMKKCLLLGIAAVTVAGVSGCKSAYWNDRCDDAKDIFTATAGIGGGVGVRVGPMHAGLGCLHDVMGLRGGTFGNLQDKYDADGTQELTVWNKEQFVFGRRDTKNMLMRQHLWLPMITIPKASSVEPRGCFKPYYTQIEFFFGFFPGARLGMNPGEMMDFMLGFATLDMFKDDEVTVTRYLEDKQIRETQEAWESESDADVLIVGPDKTANEVKKILQEEKAVEAVTNTNPQHDITSDNDPVYDGDMEPDGEEDGE